MLEALRRALDGESDVANAMKPVEDLCADGVLRAAARGR
jgi:hypothetical protein